MRQCRQMWMLSWLLLAATTAHAEPAHPTQAPVGDREVVVANHTARTIIELYVSAQAADSWGQDRLNDDELAPGATTHIKLGRSRDCYFDLLAVYDDTSREESRGVNVCRDRELAFEGKHVIAPQEALGPQRSVTVINGSPRPIQQLYFSSPDAAQWGDDLLVNSSISVGEQRRIEFRGDCNADVRVVFSNRSAEERRGLDLCRFPELRVVPGWTTSDRQDARD